MAQAQTELAVCLDSVMADDISSDINAFWSKIDMDSEDSDSFIPGVSHAGNRRPIRMKGKKTKEIKAKIPVKPSLMVEDLTPSSSSTMQELCESLEDIGRRSRQSGGKISLKDLCAEDKKRVANLIKELARMGDEREKAVGQLHNERTQFEKQVLTLVEQQEQILKEREDIQRNLFQCQDLIKKYQTAILDKEEKLNTSLSEMTRHGSKKNRQSKILSNPKFVVEHVMISPPRRTSSPKEGFGYTPPTKLSSQKDGNMFSPSRGISSQNIRYMYAQPPKTSSQRDEKSILPSTKNRNNVTPPMEEQHVHKQRKKREHRKRSDSANSKKNLKCDENKMWVIKNWIENGPEKNVVENGRQATRSPRLHEDDRRFSSSPGNAEQNKENIPDRHHRGRYDQQYIENQKQNAYKPYTSQIDREIAFQKSGELKDVPSFITAEESRDDFINSHQNKMRYNEKVPVLGPFRDPIMSSTQKSTEIHKHIPNDDEFQPLIPAQSPRSSRLSNQDPTPRFQTPPEPGRVGFKKDLELPENEVKMHSPNLPGMESLFGDKDYMEYYRKLNSNQRKRELLKQRENLLLEQERLKDILVQQEQKLSKKKDQLHLQQQLQKERLEYFEQNGKFPLKKPDFHGNDDHNFLRTNQQEDSVFNGEIERLDFDKPLSEADAGDLASEAEKENIDTTFNVRNKVSVATSPISKSQFERPVHSMATSPIRMEQSKAVQHTPPRGIDAATSISYHNAGMRSPKSPSLQEITGDRQGNLPMHSNRQRTPKAHLSPSATISKKPGDKTMTVVDIVNCLEEYPKFSPSRSNFSPAHHQSIEDDPDVTEQESKILEEIFFLS